METRFVYFNIVKYTLHSACFTSTAMIKIYILGARLMSFKKNNTYVNVIFLIIFQLGLQKPVEVTKWNHSLPGLT